MLNGKRQEFEAKFRRTDCDEEERKRRLRVRRGFFLKRCWILRNVRQTLLTNGRPDTSLNQIEQIKAPLHKPGTLVIYG